MKDKEELLKEIGEELKINTDRPIEEFLRLVLSSIKDLTKRDNDRVIDAYNRSLKSPPARNRGGW